MPWTLCEIFLLAIFASFLGSLLGLGGGLILIPGLVQLFEVYPKTASAYGACSACITALTSSWTIWRKHRNQKQKQTSSLALKLQIRSLAWMGVGCLAGVLYALHLNPKEFGQLFGIFACLMSVLIWLRPKASHSHSQPQSLPWWRWILLLSSVTCAGFFSGALGIGGGAMLVPAFFLLGSMDFKKSVENSLFLMILSGSLTFILLALQVTLKAQWIFVIVTGAMVGASLGRKVNPWLPAFYLKLVFSILILYLGIKSW